MNYIIKQILIFIRYILFLFYKIVNAFLEFLDWLIIRIYFWVRKIKNNSYVNKFLRFTEEFYYSILIIFIIFLLLFFIYESIFSVDFSIFTLHNTFLKIPKNIFYKFFSYFLVILISLVNLKFIFNFLYKNIVLWKSFFILFLL
ncbi:TPA: hypothetical protein DEG21_01940 [Patescibacteria group bacterium]|nr:hypothetical protein [Candidatus Gracilibacteria bacterium]HBY74646.1 hypothetical protein [Candidatus Gracilibacteria bacterium]